MRVASLGSAGDLRAACARRLSSPVSSQSEKRVNDARSFIVRAGDVEEPTLDDIRGVEPGSDPRVQAQVHHAPEPLAMLVDERCRLAAVVAAEPLESDRSSRRASCPRRTPYTLFTRRSKSTTEKNENGATTGTHARRTCPAA
jgi:hypothetical protein